MADSNLRVQTQLGKIDNTIYDWNIQIKKMEKQMQETEDLAQELEETVAEQKTDFEAFKIKIENEFLVAGVIGHEKKTNAYSSFAQFVTEIHEFKEDNPGSTSILIGSKLKQMQKQ